MLSVACCYIMWGESPYMLVWYTLVEEAVMLMLGFSHYIPRPVASFDRAEDGGIEAGVSWWQLV